MYTSIYIRYVYILIRFGPTLNIYDRPLKQITSKKTTCTNQKLHTCSHHFTPKPTPAPTPHLAHTHLPAEGGRPGSACGRREPVAVAVFVGGGGAAAAAAAGSAAAKAGCAVRV